MIGWRGKGIRARPALEVPLLLQHSSVLSRNDQSVVRNHWQSASVRIPHKRRDQNAAGAQGNVADIGLH